MSFDIRPTLMRVCMKVVERAVGSYLADTVKDYFKRRSIDRVIEDSIAKVAEQLVPFFVGEGISESQQELLIQTCDVELSTLLEDPREIFASSMDGQKVFDRRYADGRLPEVIRHEKLEDLYAQIFPQIANLVCTYRPAVEEWKIQGFQEGFHRLDDIATKLCNIANKIDQFDSKESDSADEILMRVRQSLAQSVEFRLELVGLRGDRPDAVPLESCFIVPELVHSRQGTNRWGEKPDSIGVASDLAQQFGKNEVRGLIIGPPGSGKSTLSQWLQRLLLNQHAPRLACLVRLRDIVRIEALPTKEQLVRDAAGTHLREEVTPERVRRWCKAGQVTFILDGFDEVPPNRRNEFLRWIRELDVAVEKAGLIITSRPLTSNHLDVFPRTWISWNLNPFDEPRVISYIGLWYKHAQLLAGKRHIVDATQLAKTWLAEPTLMPLVGTPLMLATLLMVHHLDGELPKGRSSVYQRYVDGMLDLWDSRWKVPTSIQLPLGLKKRILTHLALYFHLANLEQLGDTDMQPILAKILLELGCNEPTVDILNYLRERSGLLIGPGTWSFVHRSVCEFLVASAICDGDHVDASGEKIDRLRLFKERHNDRWNTVLFLWAGLASPADIQTFIEQVTKEPDEDEFLLGIGLIYDQLLPHRLSQSWFSEIFMGIIRKDIKFSIRHFTFFAIVPHGFQARVEKKLGLFARGVTTTPLGLALRYCCHYGNLTWVQALNCHESLLLEIWVEFSTNPRNTDDLRSALDKQTWPSHFDKQWLVFPLIWGIGNAAKQDAAVSLDQYLEIISERLPEYSGGLVAFIMGSWLNSIFSKQQYSRDTVKRLLTAINDCKKSTVSDDWRSKMSCFVCDAPQISNSKTIDLFSEFALRLNEAVQTGWVQDKSLANSVLRFVNELRVRCDAMPALKE